MKRIRAALALLAALWATAPAVAGAPIGPCSPYAAEDGDIPSELPGCTRRLRPAPGSLADELEFRGAHRRATANHDPGVDDGDGETPPPRRPPRRARRPGAP